LFAIAASLALFGAVMVYSASAMIALKETEGASQFTYFYKQFGFTLIGLMVMYATSKIDYQWYQEKTVVYGILAVTAILLLAVFGFPPINGARRWIRFPGVSFRPLFFVLRPSLFARNFSICSKGLLTKDEGQTNVISMLTN
jgi:cell division protein FtsW